VLAYDSDAAGQSAAEKWYGWEQRYEIQIEVADLPAGRDPADVWRDDPQVLLQAVERATPFLQFRLDRVLAAADRSTLEGRARAAEAGALIVAQHPSDLVRDQYVMKLAGDLDIDADRLRETVARDRKEQSGGGAKPPPRPREEAQPARAPAPRVDRRELDVLLYAVHEPEIVVDWLDDRLFADSLARAAFDAIAASDSIHDAIASTDEPVRDLLERVAVEQPVASDEPETLRAHLMANTIGPAAQRELAGMLRAGDERATSLKLLLDALAHARELGDWEAVQHDAFELLGWLGEGRRGAGAS
jgi:DNA primase